MSIVRRCLGWADGLLVGARAFAVLATALVFLAMLPQGASASLASFQEEGVPVPSWFTDTAAHLGCALGDSQFDQPGITRTLECGYAWTAAGCNADMDQGAGLVDENAPTSPGGYRFAEFGCNAAAPGASPPDQCARREASFLYDGLAWQPYKPDTDWVVQKADYDGCVWEDIPITFTIAKAEPDNQGGAKLTIRVPGPGELRLTGAGVRPEKLTSQEPGKEKLPVAVQHAKRRKLNRTGEVKVRVKVIYKPSFGDGEPSTHSETIRLHKRVK
jgi:hypothetical protein